MHDSAEVLRRKLAQQRKEATEKGLQDAGDLFKKIEEGIKDLASKQGVDRKQALVELNDLAKQLEARKKELGGEDKLQARARPDERHEKRPGRKTGRRLEKRPISKKPSTNCKSSKTTLKADKLDPKEQQRWPSSSTP